MKIIPLTQGQQAIVDDHDFDWLIQFKWHAHRSARGKFYAQRRDGKVMQRMHRLITGYELTDHIDGDGLNNRRSNLRRATPAQNMMNRIKWTCSESRFKGVYRATGGSGRWNGRSYVAKLRTGGIQKHIGTYPCEEDAARAYDDYARRIFGAWGTYNFPHPGERSALTGEINLGELAA